MAGYVEIGDRAFISGGVVVHQFSRIGTLAMIGGNTRVNADVPPYLSYTPGLMLLPWESMLWAFSALAFRRGVTSWNSSALTGCYTDPDLKLKEALDRILTECGSSHARQLVDFVRGSERGICRP